MVESDSEVAVQLVLGTARCYAPSLLKVLAETRSTLLQLQRVGVSVQLRPIARAFNMRADQLSKHAVHTMTSKDWATSAKDEWWRVW